MYFLSKHQRLKPDVAGSSEILELSKNFVMVNAEDDEAPHGDSAYELDGGYIPRILFSNLAGEVQPHIKNTERAKFHYYYPTASAIAEVMKEATRKLIPKSTEHVKEEL